MVVARKERSFSKMPSQNRERGTTVKSGVQGKNINIDDTSSFKSIRDIDSLRSSSPFEHKLVHKESEAEGESIRTQAATLLKALKRNQALRLQAEELRKKREKMEEELMEIQDATLYLVGNPAYLL